MAALGEKIKFLASTADGLADEFLAIVITFGGVDHVQTGIECAVQQFGYRFRGGVLVSNLGSAEPEDGNVHICFSEAPLFHVSSINRGLRGCKRINAKEIGAIRSL